MESKEKLYWLLMDIWKYIKTTPAPAQDDHAAWKRLVDENSRLHHEFAVKLAEWMELLGKESRNGKENQGNNQAAR